MRHSPAQYKALGILFCLPNVLFVVSLKQSEILEVFREELQEASRQKQYLDQLYALMLERAPELLEEMDQEFEAR